MVVTKTVRISAQASLTSFVATSVTVTWSGALQAARIGGILKTNYGPGLCDGKGSIAVNGVEVGSFDMAALSYGYAEGAFSFDIRDYLANGANQLSFWTWCAWGWVPVVWVGVEGTLTVTADDVVIITPPTPTDLMLYLAAGAILVAGMIGAGYFIRQVRRK